MKNQIDKKWDGYTFDELKYQIVINRVSFNVTKQHIANFGREGVLNPLNIVGGKSLAGYFEKVMSTLSYFGAAVKIVKRIREILK